MSFTHRLRRHARNNIVTLIFFTALAMLLVWSSRIYIASLDEGMLYSSAMKVADGQVMYRDFFEFWTPGSVYTFGWLFKMFGANLWVSRAVYFALIMVSCLLAYVVFKQAGFSSRLNIISVALFALIVVNILANSHHLFGLVLLLATIIFLQKFINTQQYRQVVLAGIMAGLTALFMQYEGVVAIVGGIIVLSTLIPAGDKLKSIGVFLLPISLIAAGTFIIFLLNGALNQLISSTIIFPLFQYKQTNTGAPSLYWLFQSALIVLCAWVLARRQLFDNHLKLLVIFASILQLVGLATISVMHALLFGFLTNSVILYSVTIMLTGSTTPASLWRKVKQFPDTISTMDTKVFAFNVVLALFLIAYGAKVIDRTVTLLQASFFQERWELTLPAGTIQVTPMLHSRISNVADFIDQHTEKNQSVYFGPYSSYYNFLLQRPNPLRYSQLTPGYNTQQMFQHAVEVLQQEKPEYVVFLPREAVFSIGKDNALYQYIEKNYHIAVQFEDLDSNDWRDISQEPPDAIWQRKTEAESSNAQ